MKEEEIRPSLLFKKYLELCQEHIKNILIFKKNYILCTISNDSIVFVKTSIKSINIMDLLW